MPDQKREVEPARRQELHVMIPKVDQGIARMIFQMRQGFLAALLIFEDPEPGPPLPSFMT